MSTPWPSLKAQQMLRVLRSLGYVIVDQKGSHRRLECDGRPDLTFAYHDKVSIPGGMVRVILVRQVGLSMAEGLEAIRNA